eukprot:6835183-Prymnesium_polylepis.1
MLQERLGLRNQPCVTKVPTAFVAVSASVWTTVRLEVLPHQPEAVCAERAQIARHDRGHGEPFAHRADSGGVASVPAAALLVGEGGDQLLQRGGEELAQATVVSRHAQHGATRTRRLARGPGCPMELSSCPYFGGSSGAEPALPPPDSSGLSSHGREVISSSSPSYFQPPLSTRPCSKWYNALGQYFEAPWLHR